MENTIFKGETYNYTSVGSSLTEIARKFPAERDRICQTLRQRLTDFEVLSPTLNVFFICDLVDLEDIDSVDLIKRVFSRDFVNEDVVDWGFLRKKLGTKAELPRTISYEKYAMDAFHYSGDLKFGKLLDGIGSAFNVDDLKCFLLGSILAVDFVQPSVVMSEVFKDWEDEEIEFVTQGQADYAMREFLGLWNSLCEYQNKVFELRRDEDEVKEGLFDWLGALFKERWRIVAFLDGLEMGKTDEK